MRRAFALLWMGCATSASGGSPTDVPADAMRPPPPLEQSPPPPGPTPALRLPTVTREQLDNGLHVWIAEQHAIPRVSFALVVLAGADADPPRRAGLAAMTADLLDEGAGERGAMAIAGALADEGAALRIFTTASASMLTMWVLSRRDGLEASLAVLGDIVTRPSFLAREIKRVRSDRLAAVLQRRDQPGLLADETLARAVYGAHHPYGWPVAGDPKTLSSIRRADVRRFWRTRYRPDNAAMIVVGAIRAEQAISLLESAFGGWQAPAEPSTEAPGVPEGGGPRMVIVDRPGAPQSEIRVGHVGISRAHPDAFVVEVLGHVLGGSFASRLNNRLREQLGYTYGAWGGFEMRRGPGPFVMGAAVRTEVTAAAIGEMLAEVRRLCAKAPTESELDRAQNGLLRSLPARFEGAPAIARELAGLFVHDLPPDYFDEYVRRVGAVTATDVQRAACEHTRVDDLQVVVVGDRRAVEGGLADLGLGAPEVWDAAGSVVR